MPKHNQYPITIPTRNGDIIAVRVVGKYIRSDFGYRDIVLFQCFCGNTFRALAQTVADKKGRRNSCGCMTAYLKARHNTKHGLSDTPEHKIWRGILDRCYNPRRKEYPRYGGRGIRMHEPWIKDFKQFYDYIGKRPSPAHSVERIDNSRGYEPGNIRWATRLEQQNNMRSNTWIEVNGERMTLGQLYRKLGIPRQLLYSWHTKGKLESKTGAKYV